MMDDEALEIMSLAEEKSACHMLYGLKRKSEQSKVSIINLTYHGIPCTDLG